MASLFSRVRQVYLMGGEPLLHPEVHKFVRLARQILPDTNLYLLTNGVLVTEMSTEFWRSLADSKVVLMISSYPIELPRAEIESLAAKHGVLLDLTPSRDQFHKIPIDLAGGHDRAASFAKCRDFNNCPMVRNGRLYPCAYTALAGVFREHFGVNELMVSPDDWIELSSATDPEEAMRFLTNPVPWCANCDMNSRTYHPWDRSSMEIGEWIQEPDSVPAD